MNVTRACLVALTMSAAVAAARAQHTPPVGSSAPPPLLASDPVPRATPVFGTLTTPPGAAVDGTLTTPLAPRLSDWILGNRACDCCGPAGGDGPVCMEVYWRTGVSFPIDSSFLGRTLKPGWIIQGGGRSLFFNPTGDAAWTIDLGLSHTVNAGKHDDRKAVLLNTIQGPTAFFANSDIPAPPGTPQNQIELRNAQVPRLRVSTRKLHRTTVDIGFGREWYLWGSAPGCCGTADGNCCADGSCGNVWRIGVDGGGRWGSANLELNEIRHRTDVIGGIFFAAHSDLEIPYGCCVFTVGSRVEWDYTWSDVLQRQNDADVQSIKIMATFGVRF